MFPSLLTQLQRRILEIVARRLPELFITGGSALGAFHLGHRRSADLDLFTHNARGFDSVVRQFQRLMEDEGLFLSAGSAGPGFRRFVVSDGDEQVPVDVVADTTPEIAAPLVLANGLRVDSLDDIIANKLCAILGRAEVRDYVDLYFASRAGRDPLALLEAAKRKDAGLDAATLAFVLSEVKVRRQPEGLEKSVSAKELQAFIDELRQRLARAAFPQP